jgi:hypothetical protein
VAGRFALVEPCFEKSNGPLALPGIPASATVKPCIQQAGFNEAEALTEPGHIPDPRVTADTQESPDRIMVMTVIHDLCRLAAPETLSGRPHPLLADQPGVAFAERGRIQLA